MRLDWLPACVTPFAAGLYHLAVCPSVACQGLILVDILERLHFGQTPEMRPFVALGTVSSTFIAADSRKAAAVVCQLLVRMHVRCATSTALA